MTARLLTRRAFLAPASRLARYQTREEVDFVIVGSGAAGGVLARELSTAGFSVVVLEQGPYRRAGDFKHDEVANWIEGDMLPKEPHTFRRTAKDEAKAPTPGQGLPPLVYAQTVGGASVHFTANYWRLRPVDFHERSLLGPISGTGFADWPVTYEEMEPYYTKVEWDVGVSGAVGPDDPPRTKGYPHPPLPVKSSGVLFEKGARALGHKPFPAPMAILSEPRPGRNACVHCGYCMGFGCEMNAKSSTLASMIPEAEATGRCEIRTECTVHRVETDDKGRAREVVYFDKEGNEQAQRAKAVILSANGAETPRLLLMSESSRFPHGLANSSGVVGKYLMFNGNGSVMALFEEPLNEYKSQEVTRVCQDWYEVDPKRGFYGGGGMDGRLSLNTPVMFAVASMPPDAPRWGLEYRRMLAEYYTRCMEVATHSTSLAMERNNITLDANEKDKFGRPTICVTYDDHPDDLKMVDFLQGRAKEIIEAAGAKRTWSYPAQPQSAGFHLLGTCRMGNDAGASVVDRYHRTHDVPNLFICDGSSFVTSGRGQPTMTIQALAFRAADHIAEFARKGEI